MHVEDLEILENLIQNYKNETEEAKKRVFYIKLVQESLTLVKKIVSRIYPLPCSISKEDLIQVGAIGALNAIQTYKITIKGSFKTYATKCIRGRILHYLRDKANLVKPPRESIELINKIRNAIDLLAVKYSRPPSVDEISLYMNIPAEKVNEVINIDMLKNIVSLDQTIFSDDGNETLLDRLQQNNQTNFEEVFENKKIIEYAINKLPETDRIAITMYYLNDKSRKDVSEVLKVSTTQVSRILKRALNKLYVIIKKELDDNKITTI